MRLPSPANSREELAHRRKQKRRVAPWGVEPSFELVRGNLAIMVEIGRLETFESSHRREVLCGLHGDAHRIHDTHHVRRKHDLEHRREELVHFVHGDVAVAVLVKGIEDGMYLVVLGPGAEQGDAADQLHQVDDAIVVAVEQVEHRVLGGVGRHSDLVRCKDALVGLQELLAAQLAIFASSLLHGCKPFVYRNLLQAACLAQLLQVLELRVVFVLGLVGALRQPRAAEHVLLARRHHLRRGAHDLLGHGADHRLWLVLQDSCRRHIAPTWWHRHIRCGGVGRRRRRRRTGTCRVGKLRV
mmetsp:Transcript_105963/g.297942  ORF Transcript_105963/g.297942 Transcript_105963/m.297942 type:complete len:299 (+) Transcript_105963:141-1037(+)